MFPLLQIGGVAIALDPISAVLIAVLGTIEAALVVLWWALLGHAAVAAGLLPWIVTRWSMSARARAWWCLFVLLAPVSGAVVWCVVHGRSAMAGVQPAPR